MRRFAPVAMLVGMVLVRTAALLALMKLLAVQFGADGFGQLSQILAVGALFSVLAGGGLTNGIVRNLAASENPADHLKWIKAALPIAGFSALLLALVAWLLHATAADALFAGAELGFVLIVIALSQAIVGFGNIALAYLSGTQNIRAFTFANGAGSIAAAALIGLLSYTAGFKGAAAGCAAMGLLPAVVGIAAAVRRVEWQELRTAALDRVRVTTLLRFGGSMYVAAAAVPLAWVYIRSDLALREGWEAVGLWQSVSRISEAYMQVFGIIFMNYALPKLAAAAPADRLPRLRYISVLIFSLFVIGTSVLYFSRETILTLAFSPAFVDAAPYLAPQIIGDAFKLTSLLFVYYLMSRDRPTVLASMEVLQALLVVAGYLVLVRSLGPTAAVMSYAIATSLVMVATMLVVVRNRDSSD